MKLNPPPYYRMWIYGVNGLIIFLQVIFLILTQFFMADPRSRLFPITLSDPTVIFMFIAHSAQFIACFFGILGVFCSFGSMIRVYWLLMCPIIISDLIRAIFWSLRFQHIHQSFSGHLAEVVAEQIAANSTLEVCAEWAYWQADLRCCAPVAILKFCGDYDSLFIACAHRTTARGILANCKSPLLRWLHSKVDILGVIAYFALVPLKLTVVFVLRGDIHELFSEIFYADHPDEYSHWANEPMVVDDNDSTQRIDHDSNQSLLHGQKVFGG